MHAVCKHLSQIGIMDLTDSWYVKQTQVSEDVLGQEVPLSDRSVSELRGEAGLEKQRQTGKRRSPCYCLWCFEAHHTDLYFISYPPEVSTTSIYLGRNCFTLFKNKVPALTFYVLFNSFTIMYEIINQQYSYLLSVPINLLWQILNKFKF